MTENHYADKLKVLQWQEEIAEREGMHGACCPAHVEELVIHWMTTGSLDFPFATTASPLPWGRRLPLASLPLMMEPDTRGARQIGELAVHRESMGRLLNDSPDSLQLILDELTRALQSESASDARFASRPDHPRAASTGVSLHASLACFHSRQSLITALAMFLAAEKISPGFN